MWCRQKRCVSGPDLPFRLLLYFELQQHTWVCVCVCFCLLSSYNVFFRVFSCFCFVFFSRFCVTLLPIRRTRDSGASNETTQTFSGRWGVSRGVYRSCFRQGSRCRQVEGRPFVPFFFSFRLQYGNGWHASRRSDRSSPTYVITEGNSSPQLYI